MFKYVFFLIFFLINFFSVSLANIRNNMVLIPSGSYIPLFKYGDYEGAIYVNEFMMNKYPITNLEFMSFIIAHPKWNKNNVADIFVDSNYLTHWNESDFDSIKSYPVVNVSWFAASAYCDAIGGRLPTIDEWEYVASAGKYSAVGKNEPNYLQDVLDWYINSQVTRLVEVNDMVFNYWGVYGMHGIIWEWVSDFNSVILLNTDAEGGGLEEVLYCGATATNAIDPADYVAFMRFAFRNTLEASYTMSSLGFRCAKNVN